MTTGPVGPDAGLAALAEAGWDALLERAHAGDPLQRLAVLRVIAADEPPAHPVLVVRDGRAVAGTLLVRERRRGLRVLRTFGPSAARFDSGPHLASPHEAAALADALRALPADVLTLSEIPPDHPVVAAMAARAAIRLRPEAPTYRVRPLEAAAHLAKRRREAGRILRRAARHGEPLEIDTIGDPDALGAALPAATALHRRRWEGRPGDASVATEAGRRLTERIVERLRRDGALRLTRVVRPGGAPVAFALAAVSPGGRAIMYLTAHDRGLLDASGLGATALVGSVDALAAEGVTEIDLGSGGDHFKAAWAEPEPVVTLQAALTPAGRALLLLAGARARAHALPGLFTPSRGEDRP